MSQMNEMPPKAMRHASVLDTLSGSEGRPSGVFNEHCSSIFLPGSFYKKSGVKILNESLCQLNPPSALVSQNALNNKKAPYLLEKSA